MLWKIQNIVLNIWVHAGTREHWPYLILLQAVPALLSFVVLPCIPETPRYLLFIRRDRQAAIDGMSVPCSRIFVPPSHVRLRRYSVLKMTAAFV